VLATARAHVHREILESFREAVNRCDDEGLRRVLGKLCDLYALAEIEADRGWFQEHGRISSTRAKAIIKTVNALCAEVRADAEELVDAFGIPDEVLAAPIALPGGSASRQSSVDASDIGEIRRMLREAAGTGAAV
jgi:acyl-CoA oxidase